MSSEAGDTVPQGSRGLPKGLKVLFGCLGVAALLTIVLAVALGVGVFAVKRGIESTVGSYEEHQEASEALARLEREYPYEAPADGEVTDEQVRRFLAVTDRAWEEIRPWADEVEEFRARAGAEEEVRLRDALTGARTVGGVARSRVVLARALEAERVSLAEYAWTGLTLARADAATRRGGSSPDVPEQNVQLVTRHREALPDFESGEPGRATVLAVATLWGLAELSTWHGLGLDTLVRR